VKTAAVVSLSSVFDPSVKSGGKLDRGCKFRGKGYDISGKLYLSCSCFLQCEIRLWEDEESKGFGKIWCCAIVVFVEFMEPNASDIRKVKGGIALGLLWKMGRLVIVNGVSVGLVRFACSFKAYCIESCSLRKVFLSNITPRN